MSCISGMIKSMADLGMFVKRTLLNIQQPDESMNLAESALNFLQTAQFVERKEGESLSILKLHHIMFF